MSAKKYGDLLISLAGPMVNLIMFCSLYVNFLITKSAFSLDCALINLAFFTFNMLPVSGLDGGTVLKIILSKKFKDPLKAERIVRIITLAVGLLVGIIGITLIINGELNISVFIVAIYIIISAFIRI